MKGFPKYFNTKQDYINCLSLYPSETKQALRALMNNRYKWVQDGELAKESDGITDDDHYVVKTNKEEHDGKEGEEVIYQMKRVEDKDSKFFKLGFTVAEVKKLVS